MTEYGQFHVSDDELVEADYDAPERTIGVHPKVQSAAWAGAVTVVLVFVAGQFGVDVPAEVAAAVTVLISTAAGFQKGV